ncbi:MAG: acyl carrier protein [Symbiopectobacterium sp.]|uniref:acyl carrier protein n=1 Tax=Symbiopectobacterium sp. TaxID=2952789 RepID=UPI0039E7EAA4
MINGSNNEHLVKELIYQVSGIPIDRIGLEDSLLVTLGLDSVEMIDLLMRLETFRVTIPSTQITAALRVRNIVEYLAAASCPEGVQRVL